MKNLNFLLIVSVGFASSVFCNNKSEMPRELSDALLGGDLKKVKNLDVHIQKKTLDNKGALHLASAGKVFLPLLKYLIEEKNFEVDAKDNKSNTPFLLFAQLGHDLKSKEALEIVKYFLSKKADINARNKLIRKDSWYDGITPLDAFCRFGDDTGIFVDGIMKYIIKTKGKEITSENIDSSIKMLNKWRNFWIKRAVNKEIPEHRRVFAEKRAADLKKKHSEILKMLNDLKAKKVRK